MRINGGGSPNVNQLESDAGQYRNRDFVVENALAFGGMSTQGGVSAEYSHVQLFNPDASPVDILVDDIIIGAGTAQLIRLSVFGTALTTDSGSWINLKPGASAGQGEIRTQTNSSRLGTIFHFIYIAVNESKQIHFDSPILLEPGEGVLVMGDTVNTYVVGSFRGREI